jgi:hemolysin III
MPSRTLLERPRRFVERLRAAPHRLQTRREEVANSLSHGVGFAASLIAGPLLVAKALRTNDPVMVAASVAYVVPLAGVFFCSTVSHAVDEARRKLWWEQWDQATIYLLIAGSFTPFAAAYLRQPEWYWLTISMWVLALAGFLSKAVFRIRVRKAIVSLCVLLGWLPAIAIPHLLTQMHPVCFQLALVGGVCYTLGTLFLLYDRAAPFLHVLWHVAVLIAAALHYAAIYIFVVA